MIVICVFFILLSESNGCRDLCSMGMCGYGRRRRSPGRSLLDKEAKQEDLHQRKKFKQTYWGCTPWWAQLSLCLKIPFIPFRDSYGNSEWYRITEKQCGGHCLDNLDPKHFGCLNSS